MWFRKTDFLFLKKRLNFYKVVESLDRTRYGMVYLNIRFGKKK